MLRCSIAAMHECCIALQMPSFCFILRMTRLEVRL